MSLLQQHLIKQLTNLEALEQLLFQEKEVLQQQSPNELTELNKIKNSLLLTISELDQSISNDPQFSLDKNAGLLTNELKNIEQTLQRCKAQNDINGQIITKSQLTVERLKTSLLENHNKSSMTYDSSGKTSGGLSSLKIEA